MPTPAQGAEGPDHSPPVHAPLRQMHNTDDPVHDTPSPAPNLGPPMHDHDFSMHDHVVPTAAMRFTDPDHGPPTLTRRFQVHAARTPVPGHETPRRDTHLWSANHDRESATSGLTIPALGRSLPDEELPAPNIQRPAWTLGHPEPPLERPMHNLVLRRRNRARHAVFKEGSGAAWPVPACASARRLCAATDIWKPRACPDLSTAEDKRVGDVDGSLASRRKEGMPARRDGAPYGAAGSLTGVASRLISMVSTFPSGHAEWDLLQV